MQDHYDERRVIAGDVRQI